MTIRTTALALVLLAPPTSMAEIWVYEMHEEQEVAMKRANLAAAQAGAARGTCQSHYSNDSVCKKAQNGKYQCGAAFSKYARSCRRAGVSVADQIREAKELLDDVCKGKEAACAAAVGG